MSIDHETFQRRGLIRCEKLIPAEKVVRAREPILRHFEKKDLWRNGEWVDRKFSQSANHEFGKRLRNAFKHHPILVEFMCGEIPQVVQELVNGRATYPMMPYPHLLFTLPNAESWTVPHDVWHLDLPRLANPGIPGVQIFTFLAHVVPGGGGTLVVAGSHQLLNEKGRLSSQELKKQLKRLAYFQALMAKDTPDRQRLLNEPGVVGDVELQVVELHGEPGDVYFMDLRLLHTIAPNATTTPRIMLTQRYLLEDARAALYKEAVKS